MVRTAKKKVKILDEGIVIQEDTDFIDFRGGGVTGTPNGLGVDENIGLGAGGISNDAYNESTWNGVTTIGASKDALRDKIENLWSKSGNAGVSASEYLGTSDAVDFFIRTNALKRARFRSDFGLVGFGRRANADEPAAVGHFGTVDNVTIGNVGTLTATFLYGTAGTPYSSGSTVNYTVRAYLSVGAEITYSISATNGVGTHTSSGEISPGGGTADIVYGSGGYIANGSSYSYQVYALYEGGLFGSPSAATPSSPTDDNSSNPYSVTVSWAAPSNPPASISGYRIINTTTGTSTDVGIQLSEIDSAGWGPSAGVPAVGNTSFTLTPSAVTGRSGYVIGNTSSSTFISTTNAAEVDDFATWGAGSIPTSPVSIAFASLISEGRTELAKSSGLISMFGAAGTFQKVQTYDLKDALVDLGFYSATGGATPLNLDGGDFSAGLITGSSVVSNGSLTVTSNSALNGSTTVEDEFGVGLQSTNTSTGAINNLSMSAISHIRFTGAAPVISGFTPGNSGKFLYIHFNGATSLTLLHQSGLSSANNRITTPDGQPIVVPPGTIITLQYNSPISNWYVLSVGTATAYGTYTPTRSAEANMDANVTMSVAQYMRVGKTVTVSGRFTADPTLTATASSFEMTLPLASNIGAVEDCAGVAFCGGIAGMGAEVIGVVANDTAKVQWISSDITSKVWSYTFTYQII